MRASIVAFALLLSSTAVGTAHAADFSVGWISRLPRINYVWKSKRPAVVGWPKVGQRVTWVANVRNLGDESIAGVDYRWLLDGNVVASGQADFTPHSLQTFDLQRTWKRTRQELVFEIDPANGVAESEERNNRLLVHTDALGVGFWVEESFWNASRSVVTAARFGASTFDDWMQRRIRQYNEMAALAQYPETPNGVMDRWRIDAIHVVPDGALPVSPVGPEVRDWGAGVDSYPFLYPDSQDRSIDMELGFPAIAVPWYAEPSSWTLLNDSLIHELGHARYLIDVYAWDVSESGDVIGIDPPPPSLNHNFHVTPEQGMMHTSWGYIDRYSAIALNRIAGHRATQGHYNEPTNIGAFLNDLPKKNRVRFVTPDGATFPRSRVRIYRASGAVDPDWAAGPYKLLIDGTPDLELETDAQGTILLGRNPFSAGPVALAVDRNNALAIVEVVDGETSHWGYLEAREFNLAYWRGNKNLAQYDLVVDAPVCFGTGVGPNNVTPSHWALVDSLNVLFQWTVPANELWYAVDGGEPLGVEVSTLERGVEIPIPGRHVAWWLVFQRPNSNARCPRVRSGIFFFDLATH